MWKTLNRVQHSDERLAWGGDYGQGDEKGFFTPLESLDKGELAREDNNLDRKSVRLEVFKSCHANVINRLIEHLNNALGFSPSFEVGIERKCKPKG